MHDIVPAQSVESVNILCIQFKFAGIDVWDSHAVKGIEMCVTDSKRAAELSWLFNCWCCAMLDTKNTKNMISALLLYIAAGLGITAGAHRLWSHRSYKAKLPLRILLALFNAAAYQVGASVDAPVFSVLNAIFLLSLLLQESIAFWVRCITY